MDFSKLTRLQTVEIKTPCPESWDAMAGDEQRRFCGGCGCFVHNIAELPATEAENLLSGTEKVCTRMVLDEHKGMLTRDGWVPRLLMASAVAASLAGCGDTSTEAVGTPRTPPISKESASAKPIGNPLQSKKKFIVMGDFTLSTLLEKSADKLK